VGPLVAAVSPTETRARSGVAAISHSIGLHHRVQDLEAQVARYEAGKLVVLLDPSRIRPSKWKNRHESSFETPEFAALRTEIESAGGNVQAIKCRPLGKGDDGEMEYEVVFGRRRLRACQELGLPVAAIVEAMDDVQVFTEMERENRNRRDLSPWEQGMMYKDALDAGLFSSQRRLADALNISQGNLSVALRLSALPAEVVEAFPSPLDLQYRWGTELFDALQRDTARVLTVAGEIAATKPRPSARETLARLVARSQVRAPATRPIVLNGKEVGSLSRDSRGRVDLKVRFVDLSAAGEKKLVEFLERLVV
jgi:ParB family chromosome partitioning protein